MTVMFLVKTPGGLQGYTAEDQRKYQKFKRRLALMEPGECFQLEYRVPRNLKHHKKFRALVALVAEHSEVYDNEDKAVFAIKVAAGHCDFIVHPLTGELTAAPKSISFAAMDQSDFDVFYENAVNGVLKHILPTMTRISFDEALDQVAQF